MALKQVMVYNTQTQKSYAIHPDMAKEAAWMAAHHLIIQEAIKPFAVTNMSTGDPAPTPTLPVKSKSGK